jgi:hypothetical protein
MDELEERYGRLVAEAIRMGWKVTYHRGAKSKVPHRGLSHDTRGRLSVYSKNGVQFALINGNWRKVGSTGR